MSHQVSTGPLNALLNFDQFCDYSVIIEIGVSVICAQNSNENSIQNTTRYIMVSYSCILILE